MVRKQCFEGGCLGRKFIQTCGAVFQVGCDSELSFLWFLGRKKKVGKKFKAVLQVLTSHEIPQRARVCCLGRGGEDATTGITASLLHPKPISWGTDQSDYRPEIFHVQVTGHTQGSIMSSPALGAPGVFSPKDTWFCLAALGSFSLRHRLEELGWGGRLRSYFTLLEWLSGEERRVRRSGQECGQSISCTPQ